MYINNGKKKTTICPKPVTLGFLSNKVFFKCKDY